MRGDGTLPDYAPISRTLTFTPGVTTLNYSVPISYNHVFQFPGYVTFTVVLFNQVNASPANYTATVTITQPSAGNVLGDVGPIDVTPTEAPAVPSTDPVDSVDPAAPVDPAVPAIPVETPVAPVADPPSVTLYGSIRLYLPLLTTQP